MSKGCWFKGGVGPSGGAGSQTGSELAEFVDVPGGGLDEAFDGNAVEQGGLLEFVYGKFCGEVLFQGLGGGGFGIAPVRLNGSWVCRLSLLWRLSSHTQARGIGGAGRWFRRSRGSRGRLLWL